MIPALCSCCPASPCTTHSGAHQGAAQGVRVQGAGSLHGRAGGCCAGAARRTFRRRRRRRLPPSLPAAQPASRLALPACWCCSLLPCCVPACLRAPRPNHSAIHPLIAAGHRRHARHPCHVVGDQPAGSRGGHPLPGPHHPRAGGGWLGRRVGGWVLGCSSLGGAGAAAATLLSCLRCRLCRGCAQPEAVPHRPLLLRVEVVQHACPTRPPAHRCLE